MLTFIDSGNQMETPVNKETSKWKELLILHFNQLFFKKLRDE